MSLALDLGVRLSFDRAIGHCDNLVQVHKRAGGSAQGRRREETSINRAIIVIAIASWQALVQDLTKFLLDQHMPQPSDPSYGVAKLLAGQVSDELRKFSTPNAENSRRLLQLVGFDPRPHWTWDNGRRGSRAATYRPHQIEQQLRDWLTIRHAIAHGDDRMPEVDVLEAVRNGSWSGNAAGPTIRLSDAKTCIKFVRQLTEVTLIAAAAELAQIRPTP